MARFGQAFFGDGSRLSEESPPDHHTHRNSKQSTRMASNALPNTRDRLFALCNSLNSGLHALETTLGIKQTTEAQLRAAHAAALASDLAYGDAVDARKAAYAALAVADDAGRTFIMNARKRLSKFFGESYNTAWSSAGWPAGGIGVPRTQDGRYTLIELLKSYFINHPDLQSADMDATAAIAETLFNALTSARTLVESRTTAAGQAMSMRDVAEANLRKRAADLISELGILLTADDARWLSFGLNRPADEETPESPSLTTVTLGTAGTLLVQWNTATRADYYRVWKQVTGTDADFTAVQSPADTDATLTGLPTGATVKVRITAVNSAGESAPGDEAQAVVP